MKLKALILTLFLLPLAGFAQQRSIDFTQKLSGVTGKALPIAAPAAGAPAKTNLSIALNGFVRRHRCLRALLRQAGNSGPAHG